MTAKLWTARALIVTALVCGGLEVGFAAAADPVKLTGCLVRADDGDGYLLINVPREPAGAASVEPRSAAPTVIGTTGVFANVFYWLDNDGDLRPHVGHQVEIEGEVKGELKDGEIKIDRKDQWTEIEVESDGRDLKARVPNTSIVAGKDGDRKMAVLVRRVDVDKVRMLDAVCR